MSVAASRNSPKYGVIVIGAMKAATSTICAFLERNDAVYMAPGVEPNYFCWDANYAKGHKWYENLLAGRRHEAICAEGSNNYACCVLYPDTAARMAAYNPDMKIIYMVRNPLARIVSAWIQNRADKGDDVPSTLDAAVQQMPDIFVGQSRYWHNLTQYREHFCDDQIFIGFTEDLYRDPDRFYTDLCAFLQIAPPAPLQVGGAAHLNKSVGKRVPSQAYSALKRLPLAGLFKALLPTSFKALLRTRILTRKVIDRPVFSPDVRADLVKILGPDAAALLAHCRKPADFWSVG